MTTKAVSLDMSLDDIIKSQKKPRSGTFRGGRGRGFGRGRGIQKRPLSRAPNAMRQASNQPWVHDLFKGSRQQSTPGVTKVMISNLDFGVSDLDIKELFNEFGTMKRAGVHYDVSGRSLGTAEVWYDNRSSALRAMAQYNGVPLDGRAMHVELVGEAAVAAVFKGGRGGAAFNRGRLGARPFSASKGGRGFFRGGRGGRGGGRRGGGKGAAPTKESLDAELDTYRVKTSD